MPAASPANFLDVGGGASPERVATAFDLVLSDEQCQEPAGQHLRRHQPLRLGGAGRRSGGARNRIKVPLVVRLAGTNRGRGRKIIADSGLPIIGAHTLAEAATEIRRRRRAPLPPWRAGQ